MLMFTLPPSGFLTIFVLILLLLLISLIFLLLKKKQEYKGNVEHTCTCTRIHTLSLC